MERFGEETVEDFIDSCLSLENLIDMHSPFIKRRDDVSRYDFRPEDDDGQGLVRFQSKEYMDSYVNPPDFLKEQAKAKEAEKAKSKQFPETPERDVLLFLLEHAPLNAWQRDVLDIVRAGGVLLRPAGPDEDHERGVGLLLALHDHDDQDLDPSELVDYADHHSGTMATQPGRLNPYKLGIELFRDIEERWDKGQFGPEYEECDDYEERGGGTSSSASGVQKIFEVRKIHNDVTFIDTFLTPDFCRRHKMFSFKHNDQHETYEIESREFKKIKDRLLFGLTNFGQPIIRVKTGTADRGGSFRGTTPSAASPGATGARRGRMSSRSS